MSYANFKVDLDGDGIALVTWDVPGRSMNLISLEAIQQLAALVEQLARDAAVKGVVITSGKDTFCAGADLTLLESLGRSFQKLPGDGEEQAATRLFEESRKLSLLYRRIETCGKPWVAAINGTAVGGGFELALACHHRVASQNPQTRLGLPEIKVGLFPGAGGTTRVARMLAPADALQFLLKGDQIKVDRAKAMKLIDAVVPPAELVKAAKDWIKAGGKAKNPWDVDGFRLPGGADAAAGGCAAISAQGRPADAQSRQGDETHRCRGAGRRSRQSGERLDQIERHGEGAVGPRQLQTARRAGLFQSRDDGVPAGERDLSPRDL